MARVVVDSAARAAVNHRMNAKRIARTRSISKNAKILSHPEGVVQAAGMVVEVALEARFSAAPKKTLKNAKKLSLLIGVEGAVPEGVPARQNAWLIVKIIQQTAKDMAVAIRDMVATIIFLILHSNSKSRRLRAVSRQPHHPAR